VTGAHLVARVEHLERVARRDRVLALAVLAVALATAQAPAAQPRSAPLVVRDASGRSATLTATALIVADASERVRADAGLDRDGYPSVDLYDKSGALRESMYLLKERPVLRLFDKTGKRRAELSLSSDAQNGEFVIRDENEVTRLAAFRGTQGLPELALYAADGRVRGYLSADDDGPYLVMNDKTATSRAAAGHDESGNFGMSVRDASGTVTWSKP
jgi:hypothetical protein